MMELFNIMDSGALTPAIIFWPSSWLISGLSELKNKRHLQPHAGQVWPLWESTLHIILAKTDSA